MGKKSQGGSQTTTQEPWGPMQGFLVGGPGTTGVYQAAHNLFERNPQMTAPFTLNQRRGQERALRYAFDVPQQIGGYQSAAATALDRYQNPGQNPYLDDLMDAVGRPFEQQYGFSTAPAIRSQFTGAGQYGSSRQGVAEGIARGLTNQAIADARARVGSSMYNTDANQAARAMALGPQTLGMGLMPSQIMSQVGGERQGMAQALLNEPFERLNRYASVIQPGAGIGGTITGPAPYTQSGGLLGGLGGGLTGASLGNLLGGGMMWPLAGLGALAGLFG